MTHVRDEKNPPLMAVASLLIPGSGHLMLGDQKLGGILIGGMIAGWILTILFTPLIIVPLAVGGYAAYDAFTKGEKHNEEDFAAWLRSQDSTIKPGQEVEVSIEVPQFGGGVSFDPAAASGGVATVPLDEPRPAPAPTPTVAEPTPVQGLPQADIPIEELAGMTLTAGSTGDTVRLTGTAKFKRSALKTDSSEDARAPSEKGVEWVSFGKKKEAVDA